MRNLFFMLFFLYLTSAHSSNQRIISLDPALTEILFDIGLGPKVVAVTKQCNFPKQVNSLPNVGDYNRPLIEKIISLKPTIILALESGRPLLNQEFTQRKIKVTSFSANQIEDYPKLLTKLGLIFSINTKKWVRKWENEMLKLKNIGSSHLGLKKGYILINKFPLILAGKNTFISKSLELCGFKNILKSQENWPQISREKFIASKPKYIIDLEMKGPEIGEFKTLLKNSRWLKSSEDSLFRLSSRFPTSVHKLCTSLGKE